MGVPISNVPRRVVLAASGTGPYNFTFEILAATDIAVYRDDTLLTLTTDYTVTINANGTGYVTLTATPTGATQIAIVGNRTISRTSDFVTGGDFFANTVNNELDQLTIFAQQNAEGLNRALQAPQTDPTSINMVLPRAADRANKTLAFDASGNPSIGISAADVANAVTYATNAANSATAAASSASSASSSASSASSSASSASSSASSASTSATNAANSASSASTSASNAASSASSASTSASNASTSATNAANSASTATTQATNAATSATNAANSASTASTQASNAASSATAAAASAAAAASSYDSFDDRYLGTKASDPTLDNDGNALVTGALYYNTTTQTMKVYDGANWIAATAAGTTAMTRYRYVATSGQTTFSGADSNALTLSYTSNNIVVNRNGSTLDTSEYTATNGTSVVLTSAAATGDVLDIVAFKSFTVADTYSIAGADAKFLIKNAASDNFGVSGSANKINVRRPADGNPAAYVGFHSTSNTDFGLYNGSGGGEIRMRSDNGLVVMNEAGTERLRFPGDAGGIKFPATQAASSDANTLDDYEEGTWTPDLKNASSSSTFTSKSGRYTKIGRLVYCSFVVDAGNTGTAGSIITLTGLPFAFGGLANTPTLVAFTANGGTATTYYTSRSGAGTSVEVRDGGGGALTSQLSYAAGTLIYEV